MNWRYIPFRHYDPYFKTGLNRSVMASVSRGEDPVVFLAGWEKRTVNIGYSQEVEEEVDMEELDKRENTVIVRRQGGGGTTYLTPEGEITWHIVAPEGYFPQDVNRTYERVCGRIAEGLEELGIQAEHEPVNDVVTSEGKISGATLKQDSGAVYVAGTLLYEVDPEEMFSLLTPGKDKLKDKKIEDFRDRISSISKESEASLEETREVLRKSLLKGKDYREIAWSEREKERAEKLGNKYRSEEWIYRK